MYDWPNLLGVCRGETLDAGQRVTHCDTAKGSDCLHHHPAHPPPRMESTFVFKREPPAGVVPKQMGVWVHGTTDEAWADIRVLNLNADHLVRNRREALKAVQKALRSRGGAGGLRRQLRAATTPDRKGKLPPFAGMVHQYVEKKLRQLP